LADRKAFCGLADDGSNNNEFHAGARETDGLPSLVIMCDLQVDEDRDKFVNIDDAVKSLKIRDHLFDWLQNHETVLFDYPHSAIFVTT
jgi:hypothetical protein